MSADAKKVRLGVGECLVSYALEHGLNLQDLEDANQALLEKRQLANCIIPGDIVIVPKADTTAAELTLNQHNIIIVSDVEYRLPIRLVDVALKPLVGVPVRLASLVLAEPISKETNSNGIAEFRLPIAADKGLLEFTVNDTTTIRPFYTGLLLPPNLEAGKKQRLHNLYSGAQIEKTDLTAETLTQALVQEFDLQPDVLEDTMVGQLA